MTIVFMGGEMGAFFPSDAGSYENILAGFNPAFARCKILVDKAVNYVQSTRLGNLTDSWTHVDFQVRNAGSTSNEHTRFLWYDTDGVPVVRLVHIYNAGTIRLDYFNGSTWITAGSDITVDVEGQLQTLDIHIVCNTASGSIKMYMSGTLRIDSGTVDLSWIDEIDFVRAYGGTIFGLGYNTYISQVIVADEPTIGMRLLTRYMNGAGATGDWTGGYTDVDEIIYNDADFISSAVADQVELFTQTGPEISGYVVRAVGVSARARRGASGPANIQLALRSAGSNYFSPSKPLDIGYGAFLHIWDEDPATSADWLNTAIDALQPGVKSIT